MTFPVDLFTPIGDKNRSEHILVSFWTLKNCIIPMLRNILADLKTNPKLAETFPGLRELIGIDYDGLYANTAMHASYGSFLYFLSKGNMTQEEAMAAIKKYAKPYQFEKVASSMLEFALKQLSHEEFVKEIVIIDDVIDMDRLQYITTYLFEKDNPKVRIVEGSISTYAKNHPEITTVIMESSKFFWEIASDQKYIQNRYFIIQTNYDDLLVDNETGMVAYAHSDVFTQLSNESICAVSYMEPRCFTSQTPLGERFEYEIKPKEEET